MKLTTSHFKKQAGIILLEGLIAILIFSMGILAIVGLQGASIRNSADAKYRADASTLANEIIGQMWADQASLAAYAHNPVSVAGTPCGPTVGASTNANVTNWLANVAASLPQVATIRQQIIVVPITNLVTVTVCWQGPQDTTPHNLVTVAQIN